MPLMFSLLRCEWIFGFNIADEPKCFPFRYFSKEIPGKLPKISCFAYGMPSGAN